LVCPPLPWQCGHFVSMLEFAIAILTFWLMWTLAAVVCAPKAPKQRRKVYFESAPLSTIDEEE
jgi:1,4-dihydroxy-2-naphthoate octaprenyltransferase